MHTTWLRFLSTRVGILLVVVESQHERKIVLLRLERKIGACTPAQVTFLPLWADK